MCVLFVLSFAETKRFLNLKLTEIVKRSWKKLEFLFEYMVLSLKRHGLSKYSTRAFLSLNE